VLQIVTGEGPVAGEALTTSPKVDAISLTGSTATGVRAARAGATHLARMVLELGGNDPLIVFDDADLDRATEQAVFGRILANGQCCCANKRLIVQRGVKDELAQRVTAAMSAIPVGDPSARETRMGPLINERAAARVHDQVRQTVEQGARVLTGGERGSGLLYPPTVLDGVTPAMDVARDMEIFGPVLPLITFDTADEAVEIANNSHFGLSAAVFTRDLARGIDLGYRIQSGVVCLNGTGLYRTDDTPFGGYKMSGLGREGLGYSLEEMTQLKAVVLCNVLS
jgi:acyl-CoA reductase-like NAD-dependent aldehyde dehydrogenase